MGGEDATAGENGAGGVSDAGGEGGGGGIPPDQCPEDDDKMDPGECGCGVPEICSELEEALVHRYSFETNGALATDSIGSADADIVGVSAAAGKVTFAGGSVVAYVDLPNGIISALGDASFEVWLQWSGGANWQRIFDFGSNDEGEDVQGLGQTYLFLSPSSGTSGNPLQASFSLTSVPGETSVRAPTPLPTTGVQHVVVVVDDTNNQLRLYRDGAVSAQASFTGALSTLDDVNNWLGRSNFTDAHLGGTIEEFRIYGAALSNAQVAASAGFGPNPDFL
jgi:hypothetical protein